MKPILMATVGFAVLVAAGAARAECPQDLDRLNRQISMLSGDQATTSPQANLQEVIALRDAAQRLNQSNDMAACTRVAQEALALLDTAGAPRLTLADALFGTPVNNAEGNQLGEIDGLILDTARGQIVYLLVERSGLLGIGGDRYPVPWAAFQSDGENRMVLPIPVDQFETAPRFDRDQWPQIATSDWQTALFAFYGVQPHWTADGGDQPGATPALRDQIRQLSQQVAALSEEMGGLTGQLAGQQQSGQAPSPDVVQRMEQLSQRLNQMQSEIDRLAGGDGQAMPEQAPADAAPADAPAAPSGSGATAETPPPGEAPAAAPPPEGGEPGGAAAPDGSAPPPAEGG